MGLLDSVAIFARMSPDDKERVLKRLKQQGRHTFMCGDGANDVGALKQAHVGVALLGGFGGANTKKIAAPGDEKAAGGEAGGAPVVPTRAEAETFQEKMKRVRETAAKAKAEKAKETAARKRDQAELMVLQKQWFDEELERRTSGEQWAQFGAMKAATSRAVAETKRRAAERQRARGRDADARVCADDAGDGGRRGHGDAAGEAGRRVHGGAVHVPDPLRAVRGGHHPPGALHARLRDPDAAGAGALLPHLRVLALRALPGRHPQFRTTR